MVASAPSLSHPSISQEMPGALSSFSSFSGWGLSSQAPLRGVQLEGGVAGRGRRPREKPAAPPSPVSLPHTGILISFSFQVKPPPPTWIS